MTVGAWLLIALLAEHIGPDHARLVRDHLLGSAAP